MTFAEKLRELKDAAGMSETKLAEVSGLTFASVHNYTGGRRTPSFPAVVAIAKALGVDCTAFAGCEDMQADEPPVATAKKPARSSTAKPAVEDEVGPPTKKPATTGKPARSTRKPGKG